MRVRNQNVVEDIEAAYDCWVIPSGGSPTHISGSRSRAVTQLREISDTVTPGYFSILKSGSALPVNEMRLVKKDFFLLQSRPFTWLIEPMSGSPSDPWTNHSSTAGLVYPHVFDGYGHLSTGASSEALPTKVHAKLNASAMDVGTFAAEFGKTVRLITGFRKRVIKLLESMVKQINLRSLGGTFRTFIDALATLWLEFRYGWRILAYDMQAIEESAAKLGNLTSDLVRTSESSIEQATTRYDRTAISGAVTCSGYEDLGITLYADGFRTTKEKYKVSAGSFATFTSQIGYIDPLSTAWELIPFSFIIDWFVNVGDVLKSASPFITQDVVYASVSRHRRTDIVVSFTPKFIAAPPNHQAINIDGRTEFLLALEHKERDPISLNTSLSTQFNVDAPKTADVMAILWKLYQSNRS